MTDDQTWWLEFIGVLQIVWLLLFIVVARRVYLLRTECRHLKEKIPSIWR